MTSAHAPNTEPTANPYKILVAVAFDGTADAALAEAIRLAREHSRAELHAVHVAREFGDGLTPAGASPEAEVPARLQAMIEAAWRESGELAIVAHVRSGDPVPAILQVAVDIGADIIVVGSNRRTGMQRFVLGSVSERVLREAHCPVLVAMPKDYSGTTASPRIEPPCPDCVAARKASGNAVFWCERHTRPYLQPHLYVPRDAGRSSIFPTY